VTILEYFDGTGKRETDAAFTKTMKAQNSEFKFAVTIPFGDRNLDTINRSEQPGELRVRTIISEICNGLSIVHTADLIHCDLKMANVVRFNGRMKLIDLDASARIYGEDKDANNCNWCKISSGIMPPEMIHAFIDEDEIKSFEKYYEKEKASQSALWKKIKLRVDGTGDRAFVVKTFTTKTESRRSKFGGKA